MKRIALLLTLLVLACGSPARAAVSTTNFVALRAEIVTQLTLASNTVPVDKKLIASLKKSLAVIDKPGVTNLVNDTKVLTLLTPLTKTSLSNTFNPLLNNSLQDFLNVFFAAAANSSNNLAGTFPSGLHTAAGNKLGTFYAQLLNADNLADLIAAAKQLAAAAKTLGVVNALVVKAESVPAPPSFADVHVSGAISQGFNTKGKLSGVSGTHYPTTSNFLIIAAAYVPPVGQRLLTLGLYDIPEGNSTQTVGGGGVDAIYFFTAGLPPHNSNGSYTAKLSDHKGSGTITINRNSTTKTLTATFNFNAPDDDDTNHVAIVTGDLVFHYN